MLFGKRAVLPDTSLQQAAAAIFGSSAGVLRDRSLSADAELPLLAQFAQTAQCDYSVTGECGGVRFALCFPLKAYRTERDRKISRWAFFGSCVVLYPEKLRVRNTCALSGKPFRPPEEAGWVKNGKTKGAAVWSEGQTLSPEERRTVDDLICWIDTEFCALWSTRYALQIRDGCITIAFWEPEIYDPESQMKLFADAMERFGAPQ